MTINKFILVSLGIVLAACGKLSNEVNAVFNRGSQQDFLKSEIISNGPGVADGTSELLMLIQLLNSDGSPVKLFRPTYEILSGTGVSAAQCTLSNDNGVSTCVLKATQAGSKRVSVTNIGIQLEKDIAFNNPAAGKPFFAITAANKSQTVSGYSLRGTIGIQENKPDQQSGQYKLFGGIQGDPFSR